MIISLPNGKHIHVSLEEYLSIKDEDMDLWYKSMIENDLGEEFTNPFTPFKEITIIDYNIDDIE